jgi:hypothetical protein
MRILARYTDKIVNSAAYSIFRIAVNRKQTLKWLFPQEKATFDGLQEITLIRKMP